MKPRKYLLPSFALLSLLLLVVGLARTTPAQTPATNAPNQMPSDGVTRITLDEFKALLASKTPPFVIDVRGPSGQQIKGAVNIPLGDFESHLNEIPRDREIVTYCA